MSVTRFPSLNHQLTAWNNCRRNRRSPPRALCPWGDDWPLRRGYRTPISPQGLALQIAWPGGGHRPGKGPRSGNLFPGLSALGNPPGVRKTLRQNAAGRRHVCTPCAHVPKSEIGSTKSETNSKLEARILGTLRSLEIGISDLFRISDFGFRISDLAAAERHPTGFPDASTLFARLERHVQMPRRQCNWPGNACQEETRCYSRWGLSPKTPEQPSSKPNRPVALTILVGE
jgi:hypothetical protein